MKIFKRIAVVLGIVIVLLLASAFLLPFLFRDQLLAMAKEQINDNVNAVVEFEDVSLSLFRDFPDLSLGIKNFSVTGVDQFQDIRLVTGRSIHLTLDLWSVISGGRPVELQSIDLESPEISVYVLKNGTANYDIVKSGDTPAPESAEAGDFQVSLRRYRISDGKILYDDHSADAYVLIEGLDHSGSGNFTQDVFDLVTETAIRKLSVTQGGIAYLKNAEAALNAVFNIDQKNSKYTLKDNELIINALRLNGEGFVQPVGDNYEMDLHLEAPENDFKNLLSLIPNAYTEGYEDVKAGGQFRFVSDIRGTYDARTERYPAFAVDLEIDNGSFQYPDLPVGISDIRSKVDINSPTGDFDDMVVDIPRFHLQVGDNPVDGRLNLKTPISDPDLDAAVDGTVDLQQLSRAYPMAGMETLSGIITASVKAKTRMSYIDRGEYEKVEMSGDIAARDLRYQSAAYPLIAISSFKAGFTPQSVNMESFDAALGRSDLRASGRIDNILAYFSPERTMTGVLSLNSRFFDVDEWYAEEGPEGAAEASAIRDTTASSEGEDGLFDRFDFEVDARADEIVYESYRLLSTSVRGRIAPNRMDIGAASTRIGESDFQISGTVTNAFDYTFEDGILGGDLGLKSRKVDLNQFMAEDASSAGGAADDEGGDLEAIRVPADIDMTIDADLGEVIYTNLKLRNVRGRLAIADERVIMENVRADALGGSINFDGGYGTRDPQEPVFNMKLELKRMDFQQSFNTFNTFRAMAPIGKFIDGIFNSTLVMEGSLTPDLMPELSTLSAQGFLETVNAVITDFKPLQSIGRQLNVEALTEPWKLTDTRNWFVVSEGKLEVKPFDIKIRGIPMTISGWHGLDVKRMDYDIKAAIPRELLRRSSIGQAADAGLTLLQKQAAQLGISIQEGDYVNVGISLTGTLDKPDVGLQLLGSGGEGSMTDQVTAGLEAEAAERFDEAKKAAEEKGQELLDTASVIAKEELDKAVEGLTKKAEEVAKEQGKQLTEQAGKEAGKLLDSLTSKSTDDIKKELEKWNPFKKKKESKPDSTKQGGN